LANESSQVCEYPKKTEIRIQFMELQKVFLVAIGGSFGAVARYGLIKSLEKRWPTHFEISTLSINLIGCGLMGFFLAQLTEARQSYQEILRPLLIVGFLGAFTTYSTFAADLQQLMVQDQWSRFAVTAIAHFAMGLLFVGLGLRLGS